MKFLGEEKFMQLDMVRSFIMIVHIIMHDVRREKILNLTS
jgi:hypothetical protein